MKKVEFPRSQFPVAKWESCFGVLKTAHKALNGALICIPVFPVFPKETRHRETRTSGCALKGACPRTYMAGGKGNSQCF
jgi:hypothetical protein